MPSKAHLYTQMAEHTAQQITGSYQRWTEFLESAARLYKYPFPEQLMIYAQRPDATACAEYDFWNEKMRRYVRRGSKGIALIDPTGDKLRLRYVFDVSDTGGRDNSRRPYLWEYHPEHETAVTAALEQGYNIPGTEGLADQLEQIAAQLANDYWNDNSRDILHIVDGSFLEDYDDFNVGVAFRNAATVSITYTLMSRCGLDPGEAFEHEDFLSIFDFNTPAAVTALGTAVSEASERVLRQIEVTIKQYERERSAEHGAELLGKRGLSDSQPDLGERDIAAPRQIREDAAQPPQGASDGAVQPSAGERQAVGAPLGDRPDSQQAAGADDDRTDSGAGADGIPQGQRPDEMGGSDEQLQSPSGGNDLDGTHLQLTLFPSEQEQIRLIDEAESIAPSAFSVSKADIDAELRCGTGTVDGKLRIYGIFQSNASSAEIIRLIKDEYGHYGHSHTYMDGSAGFVNYDPGKGMALSSRNFADAVKVSHTQMANRLRELIAGGNYLTPEEQTRYAEMELRQVIQGESEAVPQQIALADVSPPTPVTAAPAREITQADIDAAIQAWNGDIRSKHTVVRHMERHARDRDTAAFLRAEYGDDLPAFPVTVEGAATDVPWPKVQRRIAQLVEADRFYTQAEQDNLDDIDPIAVSEHLAEHGIVNGQIVDPAAFDNAPFMGESVSDLPEQGAISQPESLIEPESENFPYAVGDTVYLEDGKPFVITRIGDYDIQLQDPSLLYPIFRAESRENFLWLVDVYPQRDHAEPEASAAENFRITDDNLGAGGQKAKYHMNVEAIRTLQAIEADWRSATAAEQEILSKYVGWGGLSGAFDPDNAQWRKEFIELRDLLTPEEYTSARASTLNAHYTSPTVIKAIYEAAENMGFRTGNILEPACGVGNFFGLLPESMAHSKLYGTELDSITGRIARQLYPKADIQVTGFENIDRRDFYDLAVGNVPFGNYKVPDKAYNKLGFNIHDYFFAKAIDQVRPGGMIAFVTSRYTMDKKNPDVRRYIAQRAELLGAIRLSNDAFKANAGTEVTSDIIFLQKRDRPIDITPDWVHLGQTEDGIPVNSYFSDHPEMVMGTLKWDDRMYGDQKDITCEPFPDADLAEQLREAVSRIHGQITEYELPDLGDGETVGDTIPADPNVKNYSYTLVDGEVYFRENSVMVRPELNATAMERVKGMVELRDCVQTLIGQQLDGFISDTAIHDTQAELNRLYDDFTAKYGLINSRGNSLAFSDDSSYFLLCSLEVLDEDGNLERKADMFTKRTIKQHTIVTSVDTASEALALSISEKACVDMEYMTSLTGKDEEQLAAELQGVIFRVPRPVDENGRAAYVTADEYLSGNVRKKLAAARKAAEDSDLYAPNVTALEAAMPKDLDASEIDVRLGATWVDKEYIQEFMYELLDTPYYLRGTIEVNYTNFTAEWGISNKNSVSWNDVAAYTTYGTDRANAYRILEDTLNLRDIRIYDTVTDPDGKERRVLNKDATTLAQQKQQAIKDAFRDWVFNDPDRRQALVEKYNVLFNSVRPREYDGSHITFGGINPEIALRPHQLNAIAHILYGGNTLLAHEVGAGKTFEMVAAAMESKRLGLCQKSLFAVPNHLTEQWASEFLRLYPSANILVATKKDFETRNRKKFCARIATGDYDAVIIGHSQFERIPVSAERQERLLQEQIWEIEDGLEELKSSGAERFTIKQLERTKKSLEARLDKLHKNERKDDVVTFEQLGVDRLYVDEAHSYKNLFLYTKMRNVAGLSTSEAQKSSDMLLKCRYIDELTAGRGGEGGKGVIFATGTPVSNSMTELYTMMRYLQHDMLKKQSLAHFDAWASTFGETATAIELAPEGTGYRARTRFAKFFNLPELMNLWKEAADIKTADQLDLPTPEAVFHNVVAKPSEQQQEMVKTLSERAAEVHSGKIDPSVDNMLKITSDGRKLGLDQRIINPLLPDHPDSKVNQCVDNIAQIYRDGHADKLTQLVFCDISTPKSKTARQELAGDKTTAGAELHALTDLLPDEDNPLDRFNIYDDIRDKLVARGIPKEEIAFIHEANTEARKKELFAKVRSGQVRVLMGSTFKMGAGMNVQDRLVALHDLDCPWRPGDLEQRKGRIVRQGNRNPQVHIYRYVTEGTFDSYLWQTVENKQKFISQIMTSKSPVRSCDDVDETALSFAEIKALCAGNPLIKEKMDLDIDVARLKLLKANHQSQQYRLEDNILKHYPEQIRMNNGFISGYKQDLETLAAHAPPEGKFAGMEVKGDQLIDKDNAGAAILEACKEVKGLEPVGIGSYRGLTMSVSMDGFKHQLTLKGAMSYKVELGTDARGNLTRIDNALANIPKAMETAQARLDNLHNQTEAAKAELGKPFPLEGELSSKSARLAELNATLNIDAGAPGSVHQQAAKVMHKAKRPSITESLKVPCIPGPNAGKKLQPDREAR